MGITHRWDGTVLTITSDSGTSSADLRGEKGDDGIRGPQGAPGVVTGGTVDIDLSDYATKEYVDTVIDDVAKLQEEIGEIEEYTDITSSFDYFEGFLNVNGATNAFANAGCTDFIACSAGDVFVWSGMIDINNNFAVCEYDSAQSFLKGDALATVGYTLVNDISYTVKQGKYVRFCTLNKGKSTLKRKRGYYGVSVTDDMTYEFTKNGANSYIQKANGVTAANDYARSTDYIAVNEGEVYLASFQAKWASCGMAYYDASKALISTHFYYADGSSYVAKDLEITIPAGVTYAKFSTMEHTKSPLVIKKVEQIELKHKVKLLGEMVTGVQSNYLAGKIYCACGDSFTEGSFTDYVDASGNVGKDSEAYDSDLGVWKTYPWWIAKRNGMSLVNLAKSGSDFTNISGASNAFSVSRYKSVPKDADYITLMFGLNETEIGDDASLIGTNADTTNATLWGAYNIVFEYFLTNMPYAKIGVIISDAWMTVNYANALKEICEYWGIPYLDLNSVDVPMCIGGRHNTVSAKAKSLRNTAFQVSSTDAHPNYRAHEYRSTIIENFIRSL